MGSKFASLHIRTDDSGSVYKGFTQWIKNSNLKKCASDYTLVDWANGWISVYSEEFGYESVHKDGFVLAAYIEAPIMSVGYFDDDLIDIRTIQNGKTAISYRKIYDPIAYGSKNKKIKPYEFLQNFKLQVSEKGIVSVFTNDLISDIWEGVDKLLGIQLRLYGTNELENVPNNLGLSIYINKCKKEPILEERPSVKPISPLPSALPKKRHSVEFKTKKVVSNTSITALLTESGDLYTWGDKSYGLLGDGLDEKRKEPEKILDHVADISLGTFSAYAILGNGDLLTWGSNINGLLLDDTPSQRGIPNKVMHNIKAAGAGLHDAYILACDGTLFACGLNINYSYCNHKPGAIFKLLENVKDLFVFESLAYFVKEDGTLWSTENFSNEEDNQRPNSPEQIIKKVNLTNVSKVQVYNGVVMALQEDGTLWGWGWNSLNIFGLSTERVIKEPIKLFENVKSFCIDKGFVYAVSTEGDLYGWGSTGYTSVTDGEFLETFSPVKVLSGVKEVFAFGVVLFLKENGELLWFHNDPVNWVVKGHYMLEEGSPLFRFSLSNSTLYGPEALIKEETDNRIRFLQEPDFYIPKRLADNVKEVFLCDSGYYVVNEKGQLLHGERLYHKGSMKLLKQIKIVE